MRSLSILLALGLVLVFSACVLATEEIEVGGASMTDGVMFGVCHGNVLDGHYPGTLYACGEKEIVPYCNGDEIPATGWCQERPAPTDPVADFFGDIIARLRLK